jgi:hypothetical protein
MEYAVIAVLFDRDLDFSKFSMMKAMERWICCCENLPILKISCSSFYTIIVDPDPHRF